MSMALTIEWKRRIDNWRNELPNHFYRPFRSVSLSGFVTTEQLTVEEAARREFAPMPPGTCWGAKWEYAWFRGEVEIPREAAGRRIALAVDVGGESAIYVNGIAAGARDREHRQITLTHDAVPGTVYEIMIEAYAGHGPRVTSGGPVPPGRQTVPEPPPTQAMVGGTTLGIWEEDAYQLWMDVETLYGIRENIDTNSLRVAEIDKGLRDFTTIVDFELEHDEMMETIRAGRQQLKPLLECKNGSTAPVMFAVGHSHIDVAWLWPLAETERKCIRTFATQLALMDEYPEYRYLQSQPHLYRMVQQRDPALYERIKAAAARGQLIPEGGMWVEADTNLSGGESLIRQFIHGKRFFRDEFGVDCELLWLPDVFGYSGAMPQIMRGCGIKYFATAKIFWAYNGGDPFPYNTFTWEGIDGSEVLVHLCNDYNSRTDSATIIERWNQRVQKDGIATRLLPFGFGDGGGGPTRDHLESLRRLVDLEGVPKVRIAHPLDYFRDQEARGIPDARYVGELYFQAHRGTYTSQARTKRGNRKSEIALREAEMWDSLTRVMKGEKVPDDALDEAWKTVLLNQFHDIIPGSSIHRVYEEAEADYARVIDTAEEVAAEAAGSLTDGSNDLTVFNSLSWPRRCLIALPDGYQGATDADGVSLAVQTLGDDLLAEVTVPPCGWTTVRSGATPEKGDDGRVIVTERSLENEFLRVTLNDRGEIDSIWDKEANRELATGPCNSLRMYKDVPTNWDAWDLDSMYALTPVEMGDAAELTVIADGALVGMIEVRRQINRSLMVQQISLRRGSRRIEFDTEIDWQESHKMLKVAFPVDIHANEAVHEIQFGHIRRPNHLSRPFDADRFEVVNHKWTALVEEGRGCAVLNDCKYGVNVFGDTIMLTLLKSAMAPDMTADKGLQEFSYAFYAWNGPMIESDLVREAYELNCPVMTVSGAAGKRSLLQVDAPNVIIETVKLAEDGTGDLVVRLYEAMRTATRCTLRTDLPVTAAASTNMLEKDRRPLEVVDGAVTLDLRPFEVATLRLAVG
jgi:alpha-mannosidase